MNPSLHDEINVDLFAGGPPIRDHKRRSLVDANYRPAHTNQFSSAQN